MLIPSIDLMSGKIVQLVQGEKKALDFDDFEYWIGRFSKYPLVQLIDLDAAKGEGDNRHLLSQFAYRDLTPGPLPLPPLDKTKYVRPPIQEQNFIPEVYK